MDIKQPLTNSIKFIDLFAGVGGFRYGIEASIGRDSKAYSQNDKQEPSINGGDGSRRRTHSITCVYSNEWDKYANSVYKKHYQECDIEDIRSVKAEDIPRHDLLCAGFPCQSFSIAGKRGGFDDTRGTLFFEIARIAKQKQSPYLFLENVKGLLSHDKGRTFGRILETLDELGYDTQWQLLNSKNFGVPQNRERVFIIANLRTKPRPEIFPLFGQSEGSLKYIGGILSDRDKWLKDEKDYSRNFSQGQRVYSTKGIGSTLAGNAGGLGGKTGLYLDDQIRDYLKKTRPNEKEIGITYKENGDIRPHRLDKKKSGISELAINHEDNVSNAVIASHAPKIYKNNNLRIRRLTPLECERLQGFPDRWTQFGIDSTGDLIKMSDTQRYKMMGNAVTTNVVTAIASRLVNIL